MAAQTLSSKAGPVSIMYELDSKLQQPPIPPKEPETSPVAQASDTAYVHDGQQQYQQQVGSFPDQSSEQQQQYQQQVDSFPPQSPEQQQQQQQQQHSPIAPIPESPTRAPHSPNPSIGYSSSGYAPSGWTNQAAPRYSAPVTGYYAPGVQYNPDQSYGVAGAPYPQAQSPPPVKTEHSSYVGAPPPPASSEPPAGAVAAVASGDKKGGVCGMKTTVFLLLCVILFLVIAGAVLGGVFGSGAVKAGGAAGGGGGGHESSPVPNVIISTSTSTSSISSSTTSEVTLTPSSTKWDYPIPTGTWTISGSLSLATGSCIANPNSTGYKEVWYCAENKSATVVIKDLSSTDYVYYLDMESPARVRGIRGDPPTGPDTKNGKTPFWTFTANYDLHNGSFTSNCDVNMEVIFLLGKSKSGGAFLERAYSPNVCKQPWGGDSQAGIRCSCGYIPNW